MKRNVGKLSWDIFHYLINMSIFYPLRIRLDPQESWPNESATTSMLLFKGIKEKFAENHAKSPLIKFTHTRVNNGCFS